MKSRCTHSDFHFFELRSVLLLLDDACLRPLLLLLPLMSVTGLCGGEFVGAVAGAAS